MSALDLLNHLLNFAAPAFFVAGVLALLAGFLMPNAAGAPARWVQFALNFIAGLAVLVGGLAYFGHDGMMATYAALVVVCGTGQWLLARGWRH
ncbi:hypothetical protein WKW80_01775 [Variovorax humicola]|uniref:Uncharacterized protein n=1 Tax=Variovorax humicola TaxID=1769758 RepID=A0ABU8VUD7_9BURK